MGMEILSNLGKTIGWVIGHLRNHFLDCTQSQMVVSEMGD